MVGREGKSFLRVLSFVLLSFLSTPSLPCSNLRHDWKLKHPFTVDTSQISYFYFLLIFTALLVLCDRVQEHGLGTWVPRFWGLCRGCRHLPSHPRPPPYCLPVADSWLETGLGRESVLT